MDGYIDNLLLKFGNKAPTKPQLSPHCNSEIVYGSKQNLAVEEDTSPKLINAGIKRVQAFTGTLLYDAHEVNN